MALETLYLDDSHPGVPPEHEPYSTYTFTDEIGDHDVVLPHGSPEANKQLVELWNRFSHESVGKLYAYIHGHTSGCSIDTWEHVLTHPFIGVTGPEPFGVLCVNRSNDHKATIHQLSADTEELPDTVVRRMREADRIILLADSNIEAITAVHGVTKDE